MNDIIRRALKDAHETNSLCKWLKEQSDIYPRRFEHTMPEARYKTTAVYLSSLIRVYRSGTWYKVHLVESMSYTFDDYKVGTLTKLYQLFAIRAYQIMYLYTLIGEEDVDPNQEHEIERLAKFYKY